MTTPITREEHVIEVPQITYRHTEFVDGDLAAQIDGPALVVSVATIEGDSSFRIPIAHLAEITALLTHIRDDL